MTREEYLTIVATIPLNQQGCRIWVGVTIDGRYPGFQIDKHTYRGNRVVLESKLGRELRPGYWALHTCDVSMCVSEDHLYEGTQADNERDMVLRKRKSRGDRHWSRLYPEKRSVGDRNGSRTKPHSRPRGECNTKAKLTEENVMYIRENYAGGSYGVLAEKLGVSRHAIRDVVTHKTWTHV